MFDGLFGPWHLLIVAVVLLIFVGPNKIAHRLGKARDTLDAWSDPDPTPAPADLDAAEPPKRSPFYLIGRRLRRPHTPPRS